METFDHNPYHHDDSPVSKLHSDASSLASQTLDNATRAASNAIDEIKEHKLLACSLALLATAGALYLTRGRGVGFLPKSALPEIIETATPITRSATLTETLPLKLHPFLEARISQLETATSEIGIRGAMEDSWQSIWRIRQMNLKPATNPLIKEGELVHGIGVYDEGKLASVFKSGILSGEVELPGKVAVAEDLETFGCADFFVNTGKARTVAEYSQFAWKPYSTPSGLRLKPIEHSFVPSPFGDRKVALVVDPALKELQPLMQHSATSNTVSSHPILSKLIARFPSTTDRHLAVLGGLPSNGINKVIVGTRVTDGEIASIYKLAKQAGLNLNVFKADGMLMPKT